MNAPPQRVRVLLAEDDATNACLAHEVLAEMGCVVTVVSDGAAALQAAFSLSFDIILMDIRMPVLDGLVATQGILAFERRQRRRHTPIVAVTAGAMRCEKQLCLDAGVDEILTKPYSIEELRRTVALWCRAQGMSSQSAGYSTRKR